MASKSKEPWIENVWEPLLYSKHRLWSKLYLGHAWRAEEMIPGYAKDNTGIDLIIDPVHWAAVAPGQNVSRNATQKVGKG